MKIKQTKNRNNGTKEKTNRNKLKQGTKQTKSRNNGSKQETNQIHKQKRQILDFLPTAEEILESASDCEFGSAHETKRR